MNLPALRYSFNLEEYIDDSDVSSVAAPQGVLSEETQKWLMDMLLMLEKDLAGLVQDADPIKRILLAIKDDLTPGLFEALSPMSNIKDQALKVRKAQRNLTDRKALMIKKDSNKREAKELA